MFCTRTNENFVSIYKDYEENKNIRMGCLEKDSESSSKRLLQRIILKRIETNKLADTNIDPLLKVSKTVVEEAWSMVDAASQERSVPFKKRPYVKTSVDTNYVTKECSLAEKRVSSGAIKRSHKAEGMSSDESDNEKEHRDKKKEQKKQQPKAALLQPTNEASSSKMMHQPCQDEARAGTSATRFLESPQQMSDSAFCLDTLKKTCDQLECSKVLQDTEFTKEQRDILEQSFTQLSRKMSYIKANSNRFLKTHQCFQCDFSISHQCMSLNFIRRIPFGTEFMDLVTILPNRTIICDCGFAFFHAHLKRAPTYELVDPTIGWLTTEMRQNTCSVDFNCPKCYINIALTRRTNNVCCDLASWDRVTGNHRKMFYNAVQSCLHYPTDTLLMDEFHACSKGCCLLFHRCSEEPEDLGASGSSPG